MSDERPDGVDRFNAFLDEFNVLCERHDLVGVTFAAIPTSSTSTSYMIGGDEDLTGAVARVLHLHLRVPGVAGPLVRL